MTQPTSAARAAARGRSLDPVLALDLGGTYLRTAVVRPDGTLMARRMVATPRASATVIVDACLAQLAPSQQEARRQGIEPALLTISAPGPLDSRAGTLIDPPNLDRSLWDFPLGQVLGNALALPALLERDTQVAALAEGMFGAARGLRDYIYLTVSTGVGGAVVSDGRLLRGPDRLAGELGHMVVEMAGPPCGCGGRGHLEAFTSGTGIAAAARRAWQAGELASSSPLAGQVVGGGVESLSGSAVAAAEEAGDVVAAGIMEKAREAFAVALVSMVDIFNPERIIIGGGVAAGQGERLLGRARQRVAEQAFRGQAQRVQIVPAALGDDVGLLGGIGLQQLDQLETRQRRMALSAGGPVREHMDESEQKNAAALG